MSGEPVDRASAALTAQLVGDVLTLKIDVMCAEVVRAMGHRGLRTIVLKGPSFAEWLYRDGTRRRYGDIDLLVSHSQLETAQIVLTELGFVPFPRGDHPLRDPFAGHPWLRASDGAVVDLHVRLPGVQTPAGHFWGEVSEDTERQRVGGIRVEILGHAARAMHVATHAAQHGKAVAKPIEDLRRALEILEDADWHEAAALADRVGALPSFAAGLQHLPEGRALAARLALPEDLPADITLRAAWRTPLALGFDAVMRARGLRAKLRLLGRLAVPSPSLMRARHPLARRGRLGLLASYLWRVPYVLIWSGPALLAWTRAQRRSHPHRSPPR